MIVPQPAPRKTGRWNQSKFSHICYNWFYLGTSLRRFLRESKSWRNLRKGCWHSRPAPMDAQHCHCTALFASTLSVYCATCIHTVSVPCYLHPLHCHCTVLLSSTLSVYRATCIHCTVNVLCYFYHCSVTVLCYSHHCTVLLASIALSRYCATFITALRYLHLLHCHCTALLSSLHCATHITLITACYRCVES